MMTTSTSPETATHGQQPADGIARLRLSVWLREGLRAGFLRRPRVAGFQPTPLQLASVVLLVLLISGALGRLQINGPAIFNLRGWLAPWWGTAAILLLAWWTLPGPGQAREPESKPSGLATWFVLITLAMVPITLIVLLLGIAAVHGVIPARQYNGGALEWLTFLGFWLYAAVVYVAFGRWFGLTKGRIATLTTGMVLISLLTTWQFSDQAWWPDTAESEEAGTPRMKLNQETFEGQQRVWSQAVKGLAKERPGVTDVYGLVFAPYASEDVFLRESSMVASLLAERFDARGRVLHLVNHASTLENLPWATPLNFGRAVDALAKKMDRKKDVLVIYMTSHGASNFKLAAWHWPLDVDALSPEKLSAMLDKAGIQNRVIAVSACYSGGWIGPLANASTLLMTAAHAERTSYGCGRKSQLTYFGRAVFDEQLRLTHSFEKAFAAAVPLIEEREKQAGKADGFSDPQISVGEKIRPLLSQLEKRLDKREQAGKSGKASGPENRL